MAANERDVRSSQYNRTDGRINYQDNRDDDTPLSELLKRFGQDGAALVRQEIALAKLEVRESIQGYMSDAARIGIAAGVGLLGMLALTAFMVVGLGDLLDNYWLSALIVAVVMLGAAGIMAKGALAHMKRNSLAPDQTLQTLKDDQRWAKNEAQEFKQKLKA